jgi:hypothetical protein
MTELVRQGEVLLVPTMGVWFDQREAVRRFVVGHSELGHHHVLECENEFNLITTDDDLLIELHRAASSIHQASGHPHRTAAARSQAGSGNARSLSEFRPTRVTGTYRGQFQCFR